jgi:O-antigen/teichoic acid export membrane protein
LALLAQDIVAFLYGPKFAAAAPILRISSLQLIFIGISNYMGMQVLLHRRREGWMFFATGLAAIFGLSATMALVPHFGAEGAALGSLLAEAIVAIVEFILVAKLYPEIPLFPDRWGILVLGYGIAGLVAFWLQSLLPESSLVLRLALIPSLSFFVLFMLLVLGKEPLTLSVRNYVLGRFFRQT